MSKCSVLAALGDGHGDAQRLVIDAVGIDERLARPDAIRDLGDPSAHLLRGARPQLGDRVLDQRPAVAVEQGGQALLADGERRGLRLDVADPLVGDPDVRQDDRQDLLIQPALLVELDGRQAQALLLDLGRIGGEAARHGTTGIRPVAGVGEPGEQLAAVEERLGEAHVHQVRAAEIGVVDDDHVARPDLGHALDHRLGRELHGADEHRQPQIALGDQGAVAAVDAIRAVHRLRDHRAERGAAEREVHLVADLHQAALDHREGDGVERLHRRFSPSPKADRSRR